MTYSVTIAILLAAAASAAPRVAIEPAQPKWGDEVRLIYRAPAQGPKLHGGDPVMAIVAIWSPGTIQERRIAMLPVGDRLEAALTVPEHASFIRAYLVTKDAYDGPASTMIWNREGQPARGAWLVSMTQPFLPKDYRNREAKELALYPDNWTAYRDAWFLAANETDRAAGIRRDMALIEKAERAPAALNALSYGYLLLGNESEARRVLGEMVARFPDTIETGRAISSYEYQAEVDHFAVDGRRQVRAWHLEILRRNPGSIQSRSDIDSVGSDEIPVSTVEAICQQWIAEDATNPKPYIGLVNAYRREHVHSAEALALAEKALTLLIEGELRLHGDIYGKMTELLLPAEFQAASELARENGRTLAALAYAKAAESIGPQSRPEGFSTEAAIWDALGQRAMAVAALQEAWRRGDRSAQAKLADLGAAPSQDKPSDKKASPIFQTTSLDGTVIDSANLRGKVIVANFWFTGCGPCKAEIPDLNKLVAEFQGKDVVFLAFTLDDDPAVLRRFLKEYPFAYSIVPNAGKIADAFGIKSYPSHVVIGADGKIESMLVGGGGNAGETLHTIVSRLARQSTGF